MNLWQRTVKRLFWDEGRIAKLEARVSDTQVKVDADAARVEKLDALFNNAVVPGIASIRQELTQLKAQPASSNVDTSRLDAAVSQMEADITREITRFTSTTDPATDAAAGSTPADTAGASS